MQKHSTIYVPRINRELSKISKFPLTIVTSPMGYGKSTAVKQFLTNSGLRHIWISLNEASRDTGYFWSVFTKRISDIHEKLGNSMDGLGFPRDSMQCSRIINLLKTNSPHDDFVLVLDDYQFAENEMLTDFLMSAVKNRIPNCHIVIISRYLLKYDFHEMTDKNLVCSIDQNTLKFNDEDVKNYFSNMSMYITKDEISHIQRLTGGWAAALYIVCRGLAQGIPLANITEISDLLKKALYEAYDTKTRHLLCLLSIPDDFTADMASSITGIVGLEYEIERLCRENAFINLDLTTNKYTIHSVLRSFLFKEAILLGIDTQEIYRQVGLWHLERNHINQGFYYLFKGEDYDTMLKELEKPALYVKSSDRPMMFHYFDFLPEKQLNDHPIAYLKFVLMFIITGDKKKGAVLLQRLEEELPVRHYTYSDMTEIKAAIHLIKVFLSFNDLDTMIFHTDAVLELLEGRASVISSFQGPFSFGSPHLSYIYYREPGTYKKISKAPLEKYARASGGAGVGSEALCSAEYCLETGDAYSAEILAIKSLYEARSSHQTSMAVCAVFTLARIYILQNRYTEALHVLMELGVDVESNVESILLNTYDLCLGYIYACAGEYKNIPKWIRDGDMTINSLLMQGAVFSYVVYGKSLILSENWAKAEALCETFNNYFKIFNNQLGFIHNCLNLSIAAYKRGNASKSKSNLLNALSIGQADGIMMPFAENGANLLPILHGVHENDGINMEYVSKIIELCSRYDDVVSNLNNTILTQREVEILKLVSKGMSRSEISEKLIISTSTVKTHIQNIYQKLEVSRKSEALEKAARINII
ncbi:MAG: LuxR C-terminal-related transcriptional regulator [Sedimentibacter sp.]|uniref:LuxR C-terminal-related transcriptional regulator n=1 Tax=Sedimentibacter sp. TaxID=1960295 RepID=UPI003158A0A1